MRNISWELHYIGNLGWMDAFSSLSARPSGKSHMLEPRLGNRQASNAISLVACLRADFQNCIVTCIIWHHSGKYAPSMAEDQRFKSQIIHGFKLSHHMPQGNPHLAALPPSYRL
jgi:hypothetical protein